MSGYKPYPAYKDSGVEWLGRVPEHWDVLSFQRCVSIAEGQVNPEQSPYNEMTLIAPNHIESGTGRVLYSETAAEQNAESGKYLCQSGDVVYSKIRPALRKVCIAEESSLCSADMYPMRGHSGMSNDFLFWFLLSEPFSAFAVLEADRVAMPKINRESLNAVQLPRPQLAEQQAIVSKLDRETARIDALIEKKTRFIELLREKRQALITHAVTKGLDSNVKMKDSGVEWLGEVPEHWGVKPLKLLVKEGSTISYGIVQPGEPLDEGVPFVQTTNMSSGDFEIESLQKTTPEIAASFPRSCLTGGEVILGIRASIGAAFVVPMHLAGVNLSRGVARIDCSSELSSRFLVAYLCSMAVDGYWQLAKQGSTFNEVSIATVKELPVPVPSREEQADIEGMLSNATARLDSILNKTERSIDLLKERRAALITAAVTGQIDLREAA